MRQARQENREIVRPDIRVRTNGGYTYVDLTVVQVKEPEPLRGLLLLTLRPAAPARAEAGKEEPTALTGADHLELERELQRVRESLQTTVEELETSNEELKSSNEELQSTNEELQSTNEELETSKEEMQSLNEELNTVNAELVGKVDALARINDDMNNLLNSMQVATIFLDTRLRVKRYTDQARDVVRLIDSDIGRPLSDLTSSLRYDTLIEDCERVIATLIPVEKEVQNTSGRWYLVRLIPYRTAENVIEGVVMTTVDINRIKDAEESLRKSLGNTMERESVLSAMIEHIPMGIIIADAPDVTVRAISRFGMELIGLRDSEIMGIPVDKHAQRFKMYREDGVTPAKGEELPLTRATQLGEVIREEVWVLGRPDGSRVPILCAAGPIRDADGRITGGVMGWQDITERRRAEEELRQSDEKYRLLFESIGEGFCIVEVIFDERDKPVDYRFLEMSPSFERQTGLTNAKGKTMRALALDHEERLLEAYGRVARTGQPEHLESHAAQLNRWYDIYAWRYGRPQDRQVALLFNDITARKEAERRAKPEPGSEN
jgi:two-component system, chemotaxis family, CheB/CheR fusion protein